MKKFFFIFLLIPFLSKALPFESQNISISGPSIHMKTAIERVYKSGGNVVDMAVASALVLAVVTPFYVSLGAGGFALVDMGDDVTALDFREMAPKAFHPDYYKERSSVKGGSAVGVPGFVAGLWNLHQKYGKLSWRLLFKEAVELAEKGHPVGTEWVRVTKSISVLDYGMASFFKSGDSYQVGDVFKQQKLAKALKLVRNKNVKGFYQGKVAKDVVQSVNNHGGSMSLEDLKNYKVRWLKPIEKDFMHYTVYSMPPPSAGGIVIASALDLIHQKQLSKQKLLSFNEIHLLSEIMSRAFRSRSLIADPDFYSIPFDRILSVEYLKKMSDSISVKKAKKLDPLKETTHFVVMDKEGKTVTMTLTLNLRYGSKVVTPQYGIVLNNQMDDFTTKINQPNSFGLIQGQGNKVEAGKRPLSSTSPTLVKDGNKTIMALGGSGGPRIISGVLQVLYRSLVNKLDIDQAIQFPRIHHQFLPRKTYVEKNRFSPDLLQMLSKRKHNIEETDYVGKMYGVRRDEILSSAFDHRGDGVAWGF